MAKRFTDTDKWSKRWLRKLSLKHKIFWIYLLDSCNHAGIWEVDFDLFNFLFKVELDETECLNILGEKIVVFDDGNKWFIPKFIEFQYGELRDNNKAHLSVINLIKKHKLEDHTIKVNATVNNGVKSKTKQRLLVATNFTCTYCGRECEPHFLQIDHVLPRNKGGKNRDDNYAVSCSTCNQQKSDLLLDDFIKKYDLNKESIIKRLNIQGAYIAPTVGVKDKDKDKEKDKVKVKDKDKETFEIFWKLYPRKDDKKGAFVKWEKLNDKERKEECRVHF